MGGDVHRLIRAGLKQAEELDKQAAQQPRGGGVPVELLVGLAVVQAEATILAGIIAGLDGVAARLTDDPTTSNPDPEALRRIRAARAIAQDFARTILRETIGPQQ